MSSARSAVAATGDRSTHGYVSRPDVHAPASIVSTAATGRAGDSVFLAPFDISAAATNTRSVPASQSRSGPLVVDDRGEPQAARGGASTVLDSRRFA